MKQVYTDRISSYADILSPAIAIWSDVIITAILSTSVWKTPAGENAYGFVRN
jgi:hypothetical protein